MRQILGLRRALSQSADGAQTHNSTCKQHMYALYAVHLIPIERASTENDEETSTGAHFAPTPQQAVSAGLAYALS
jgi:hypothetical protein